jgi:hypothetical protein
VSRPTQPSAVGPIRETRSSQLSSAISWCLVDETVEEGNWPPHRRPRRGQTGSCCGGACFRCTRRPSSRTWPCGCPSRSCS